MDSTSEEMDVVSLVDDKQYAKFSIKILTLSESLIELCVFICEGKIFLDLRIFPTARFESNVT